MTCRCAPCRPADGVWSATATGTPAEHGDTRADATEVALQSRVGGAIDPGTDVDFFELEVTEETGILIFTLGALDTVGELQDNNGNIIEENDDGGACARSNESPHLGNTRSWDVLHKSHQFQSKQPAPTCCGPEAFKTRQA